MAVSSSASRAWLNGLLGVAIFSGSLPATRVAVAQIDPFFLTSARACIAGLLALCILAAVRPARPRAQDWPGLALTALGVVVGFPLFTAFALQHVTAARSLVFIGLLPLATAVFGVLRGAERPPAAFWLFALAGSACVVAFALTQDAGGTWRGDAWMLAAILACGFGYAEGARLSRHLGGWQVICWCLLLCLPAMALWCAFTRAPDWSQVGAPARYALAYVSLFSMLIGFFFWYRGLAQGGIAAVGQLQLLQPFMGLGLAAGLLGEPVSGAMLLATAAVVACVAGARRHAAAPLVKPPSKTVQS
ncbi:DMT family transporter [Orrella sp. JC864]|uniref:DMT family transporter n=1 Tax=Orrella sp. JC864 TaxID=3120298 RepID=UPI0030096D9C